MCFIVSISYNFLMNFNELPIVADGWTIAGAVVLTHSSMSVEEALCLCGLGIANRK